MQVRYGSCKHCDRYFKDYLAHEYYCEKRPPVVGFWNKLIDWFNKPGGNFI